MQSPAFNDSSDSEFDVLVIGGGPCGLSAAIALGRMGVKTLLVEKHPSTSYHPRGHVVSARTMEILRGWGLEEEVRATGIPPDRNQGVAFVRSLAGEEFGQIRPFDDFERNRLVDSYSPSAKTSCPQDKLEPVLRRAAEAFDDVSVEFSTRLCALTQHPTHVVAKLERSDGRHVTVKASYVIAADGARGSIRRELGIGTDGDVELGHQIGVYFEADLWGLVKDRPNLLWWIYNPETVGVLIALDGRQRWTYNFGYDPGKDAADDFTPERCASLVKSAIGTRDVELTVKDIRAWRMQAKVAQRLREGRIFLAGDAAHPLPPTGGQGMNTAIGDVHNLCWKLALVLKGAAGQGLLDSYTSERLPVIRFNVEQSVRNARNMESAGLGGIMKTHDDFRESDIDRMRMAIPQQRAHFDYHGQTFGYRYAIGRDVSGAARGDHQVNVYVPSTEPGSRAPHCWLKRPGGPTVSTIDLFRDLRFTLLAGREGQAWKEAFVALCESLDIDGQSILVASRGDLIDNTGSFLELYQIGPEGAVLVRPDGHVLRRWTSAVDDPQGALRDAFESLHVDTEASGLISVHH